MNTGTLGIAALMRCSTCCINGTETGDIYYSYLESAISEAVVVRVKC